MAFNIGKIKLGSGAHKKYSHNLSYDNNTTFGFGELQPLMCQLMMPDSDIKVDMKQLVRLAPMVAPTFGRMHLQNEVSFVPLVDVVPYYEAMLSGMPYSNGVTTYKPTELPKTSSAFLMYMILMSTNCKWSYWSPSGSSDPVTYTPFQVTSSNLSDVQAKINSLLFGTTLNTNLSQLSLYNQLYSSDLSDTSQDYVGFEEADEVIIFEGNYALTFRFSGQARRLRKIMIGLGYSLNINDNTPVSFVPVLAFYKAWFDLFAPKRTRNWMNTNCYKIIKLIEDSYIVSWYNLGSSASANQCKLLIDFLQELRNCWYTFEDDFVSVHRTSTQLAVRGLTYVGGDGTDSAVVQSGSSANYFDPFVFGPTDTSSQKYSLTNVGLQTLSRIARFVNKDSVIGQRISEWLKVHYGSDVANAVFKNSNHISSSRLNLEINDVMNMADTYTESGDTSNGEVLGAYAGKGIGFTQNGFKYHCNQFGYIIVMSAIVPKSGYFQGNDTSLYGINRDTLPNADFDALGYELTPKGAIAGSNDMYIYSSDNSTKLTDKSFGFVPRYSGFKVKKNIVNGDMSRRGSISSLSPYYMDRILTSQVITSVEKKDGKMVVSKSAVELPSASEEWRYCAAYPWLGNYDRIFYQSGDIYKGGSTEFSDVDYSNPVDDNFLCQNVFDITVSNCLKPISQSYDTFEEETDKSTLDVNPQ